RRVHLHDDRRTANAVARTQLGTVIDMNRREAAIEIGAMLLDDRAGRVRPFFVKLRQTDLLHRADPYCTQIDEFYRLVELEAIDALVGQAETSRKVGQSPAPEPVRIDLERKFISLSQVADIGLIVQALTGLLDALLAEPRSCVAAQPGE